MKAKMKFVAAFVAATFLVLCFTVPSFTQIVSSGASFVFDTVTGGLKVYKSAQDGGEHIGAAEAEGYQRVLGDFLSSGQKTGDAQIKASAGYVSHMICQGSDAAAVAGTIIIHDSLTETSTAIFTFTVAALDNHVPMVFPINVQAATGIYLGYTTTTDVNCTVFYR